jgi:hypothetical protein
VEDTGEYPSLQKIVAKFRARLRQTTETEVATQGTFPVTFPGQGVDLKEMEKKADQLMGKGTD